MKTTNIFSTFTTRTRIVRMKVWVEPFQKLADSKGQALGRAPQSAKLFYAVFICEATMFFFLRPFFKKRVETVFSHKQKILAGDGVHIRP